jgi:hypothetical protein
MHGMSWLGFSRALLSHEYVRCTEGMTRIVCEVLQPLTQHRAAQAQRHPPSELHHPHVAALSQHRTHSTAHPPAHVEGADVPRAFGCVCACRACPNTERALQHTSYGCASHVRAGAATCTSARLPLHNEQGRCKRAGRLKPSSEQHQRGCV